ncbi:MAG: hypothetical protein ACUVXH_11650 [Anaerolineae bacterium]
MNDLRAKFQQLLRELFQFDCAEKRFFLPLTDEIAWDVPPLPSRERGGVRGTLTIPFY